MRRLIEALFAPGRTSLKRGLLGLIVAPTASFLLVPLPLSFFVLGGDWGGERSNSDGVLSLLPIVGLAFGFTVAVTVVVGGLIWMALRASRRESGKAYAWAGAAGGALVSLRFVRTGSIWLPASSIFPICFCALAGALVALAFWFIAREPSPATAAAQ